MDVCGDTYESTKAWVSYSNQVMGTHRSILAFSFSVYMFGTFHNKTLNISYLIIVQEFA